MKNSTLLKLLMPALVLSILSCNQSDKSSNMIPADAGFVLHVNASSLSSKLSWSDIQQSSWFSDLNSQAPDSLSKILLQDPENSGIDLKQDLLFFMKSQGSNSYAAFEGSIKDAKTFEAFNKNITKSSAASATDGAFSYYNLDDNGVVIWNDKNFIYLFNTPSANMPSFNGEGQSMSPQSNLTVDSLRKMGQVLFTLDSDESLGGNERFTDLLKETGDMHMWVNAENLYNGMGAGMLSMMRLNVLFEGNVSGTTLNFDDGKITMKSRQYYGKEMSSLLKKYSSKEVSADVINRIPNQNVVAAFVMNYPPEGLKEFMKLIGVDGMVNGFLGEAGYSVDEFVKANKGDIVIAVSDLNMQTKKVEYPGADGEPLTMETSAPEMKYLFSTSINDRAAFDKMVGIMQAKVPKAQADQLSAQFSYKLDNNWFAAGNSPEHVSQFLAGGNSKQSFTSKISGHPFGAYVDIQKILASTQSNIQDTTAKDMLKASMALWEDLVFHGGEIKDGAMVSEGVITLVDKKTNSLKQMNAYFDQLSKNIRSKKKVYTEDTSAVTFD